MAEAAPRAIAFGADPIGSVVLVTMLTIGAGSADAEAEAGADAITAGSLVTVAGALRVFCTVTPIATTRKITESAAIVASNIARRRRPALGTVVSDRPERATTGVLGASSAPF